MSFNTVKALIARSSEMGSRTIVWGAIGGENKTVHGRYLDSCTVQEENDWILEKDGQTMQGNLWVCKCLTVYHFTRDLCLFRPKLSMS